MKCTSHTLTPLTRSVVFTVTWPDRCRNTCTGHLLLGCFWGCHGGGDKCDLAFINVFFSINYYLHTALWKCIYYLCKCVKVQVQVPIWLHFVSLFCLLLILLLLVLLIYKWKSYFFIVVKLRWNITKSEVKY